VQQTAQPILGAHHVVSPIDQLPEQLFELQTRKVRI
jgi:hypothetical protein